MKKLLFSLLAVLLIASVAYAVSIPQVENATSGPAVWTVQVYNDSGSALSAGDVVIWNIDNSTGDNDNYVTTTTTADTSIVAGVVYPNAIAAGDNGTIAIRGVVSVNTASGLGLNVVDGPVCSSGTAKKARSCVTEANAFGFVTGVASSNVANVFIK